MPLKGSIFKKKKNVYDSMNLDSHQTDLKRNSK